MANSVLGIVGSSRIPGNTSKALVQLMQGIGKTLYLNSLFIEPYSYSNHYSSSSQMDLFSDIIEADSIVLATPVYWYSMSAQMKAFVDRLTDLVTHFAPLGRELTGKNLYGLFTSSSTDLPEGFLSPFTMTANYFSMNWSGHLHIQYQKNLEPNAEKHFDKITRFSEAIKIGMVFDDSDI